MIEVQPPVMAITLKREHVHHIHGNKPLDLGDFHVISIDQAF